LPGFFFFLCDLQRPVGEMSSWKDDSSADCTAEVGVNGACTVVCSGDTVPELLGSGVSFGTTVWFTTGVLPVLIMLCWFPEKLHLRT